MQYTLYIGSFSVSALIYSIYSNMLPNGNIYFSANFPKSLDWYVHSFGEDSSCFSDEKLHTPNLQGLNIQLHL